jgi:hypothetical protein
MIHYLTQGYYGFGLCLQLPFVPCWGVGNSVFLSGYAEKLVGIGTVTERTYPSRAEREFGPSMGPGRWHSVYPWLASDFTFPGVALVMFLIGHLLAKTWIDVLGGENVVALILFTFLIITVFYFPANNQVVQNSAQCVPFYVTLIAWWRTRG